MNSKVFSLVIALILAVCLSNASANSRPYPSSGYQAYQGQQPYQQPPSSYYSRTQKQQRSSPVELLEKSIGNTLQFLAQPKTSTYAEMTEFVINEMAPNFDFNYMSRWIAGRHYHRLSEQQKSKFTQTFKELFIATFVQKLRQFKPSSSGAEVFRSRQTSQNEAIANVQIMHSNKQKINIDFRFLKTPKGWKVIDVKANGVSALMYYRQYFANKIRQRRD